jgi:hypothetical protein
VLEDERGRAKELITAYYGNTLQMYREGVLEEYKCFDISKMMEIEWFTEMVENFSKKLSIRDWSAVDHLKILANHYHDPIILENVIAFTARHLMSADSLVKLMYAEGIMDIIKALKKFITTGRLHHAYKTTAILLEDVISKPLIIDPGHELSNWGLSDKRSLNSRAKICLDKIRDDLS